MKGDLFRGFSNIKICLSHYNNGNIRMDMYSGNTFLGELTKEVESTLPDKVVIINNLPYAEEVLRMLINRKLLVSHTEKEFKGIQYYVCILSDDIPAASEYNRRPGKCAYQ